MIDRETLNRWYAGEPIASVRYQLNDSVALLNRPDEFASIVSLEAISPEPHVFRIVSENPNSDDEEWAFATGATVRCARRTLEGHTELVATSAAAVQGIGADRPALLRTVVAFWRRALRAVATRSAAGSSTPIR